MSIALVLLAGSVAASPPGDVDYLREVKPLLAERCVSCHGATKPRAGLRLDTAAAAIRGGDAGPSVSPGKPDESELLLAVLGQGGGERMPLKRPPLSAEQVDLLRRWIAAGAPHPAEEIPSPPPAAHWAFEPPKAHAPPAVRDTAWPRNSIDRFILSRLERVGLTPSPEADRATLIRRASLDVIGLPPTPEDVAAFEHDPRPDAYERMIDRLLASPHYGERWGRLWLDAARYADSNGYSIDAPRTIWKYRDWTITALNRDMPFDRFTIDQLAGDLESDATLDQKVATGFHRNTPLNQEGGIDVEQFRQESVHDRVATTATVWLGLTMGCCRCHDHKYDPLSQTDYYRLFAFFNDQDEPELPIASDADVAKLKEAEANAAAHLKKIAADDPALWDKQKAWEAALDMVARQKQSQEVRAAFDVVFDKRNEAQRMTVFAAFVDQDKSMREHRKALAAIRKAAPRVDTSLVVAERAEPRKTHRLVQGEFGRDAEEVDPGTPHVLPALSASRRPNRMDLARWLVDRRNPLTARVTVNRLWQVDFGRGLVETDDDFGTQGTPPSHPELLDRLAVELVEGGWSLKRVQRLILTSATYRQSSHLRPDLKRADPDNRLLARQSRLRLEAELVRDTALAASGLLSPRIGGPSVFPPQPDGVMSLGQMRREWTADAGPERHRRGMYTFFWRATPHPLFTLFDAPDATRACTRRVRSNTPLQALTLLNDEAFVECAAALADRVIATASSDSARIDAAFRLCLARGPSPSESARLLALVEAGRSSGEERAAWTTVARVVLNLDEFITRE